MCDNKDYKPCTITRECIRTLADKEKGNAFRYLLKKEWKGKGRTKKDGWEKPLIIIGCNPSTANEEWSDKTMGLVENFIEKKKYSGYIMLNLYPQISSSPSKLLEQECDSRIRYLNRRVIKKAIKENNKSHILFAFGKLNKIKEIIFFIKNLKDINKLIKKFICKSIINNDKIKKLYNGNTGVNVDSKNNYPPHFRNSAFWENGIENAGIVDFKIDEYDDYIKERLKKLQAKKASAKDALAKEASAKKASAKKTSAKKTSAKKTPAKKTPAKKTPAKKTPAKKTPAKKTPAKKTPAKKTPAKNLNNPPY